MFQFTDLPLPDDDDDDEEYKPDNNIELVCIIA